MLARHAKLLSVGAVLASMSSVQGGASIAKMIFPLVGPGGAVTLRVGLAGVLLAACHRPRVRSLSRGQWLCILLYGVSIAAMNTVFYYGIRRVPLGVGVAIEFVGPLGLALFKSRRPADFLWAALAALGIVLIVPWHGGSGAVDWVGVALVALAGLFWALYIVMVDKVSWRVRNSDAVTLGMCVAGLLVLPFGLFGGDLLRVTPKLLALGLGVAVFSSALPFTLDLLAMRRLPEKTFSILQSAQPAVGALSGLVFLGEGLMAAQWLAIACIMASSVGATATSRMKP